MNKLTIMMKNKKFIFSKIINAINNLLIVNRLLITSKMKRGINIKNIQTNLN